MADIYQYIICEIIKLRRSRMLLLSILGSLLSPFMCFVSWLRSLAQAYQKSSLFTAVFDEVSIYTLLLFGLPVYVVIGAYIFTREYTEHTLKTILPVPVSRNKLLFAKFSVMLLWILMLTTVSLCGTIIVAFVCKTTGFSWAVLFHECFEFYSSAFLLFVVLSPFMFFAIVVKNIVPVIIVATGTAILNVALNGDSWSEIFPWSIPFLISTGEKVIGFSKSISLSILIVFSIVGFVLSVIYFNKEDIK